MMVADEIAAGDGIAAAIERLLGRGDVAYLHLRNAGPGCFNLPGERA